MSMPSSVYSGLDPTLGPPIPPSMLDIYGVNSLYAAPGQAASPSILAGINAPSAVDSLYSAAGGAPGAASGGFGAARSAVSGGGLGPLAEAAGFPGLRAAAGRAVPGSLLASFGPQVVNALPLPGGQDTKDVVGNTVAGLGLGMTAAAFAPEFAPFLIPGGAALGLGKGLLENFFGDPNTPSGPTFRKEDRQARSAEIQSLMNEAGIPVNQQDQYLKSFVVGWDTAPDDAARQQGYQSFQQSIAAHVAQQATSPTTLTPEQILATQALASQVMQPYADRIQQQGATSQAMFNQMAETAPNPAIANLARTMGSNRASDATKLAGAYEQQALLLPSLNALQLANQYGQQAFAYANRPTSTGSASIQALIQQASQGGLGANGYQP